MGAYQYSFMDLYLVRFLILVYHWGSLLQSEADYHFVFFVWTRDQFVEGVKTANRNPTPDSFLRVTELPVRIDRGNYFVRVTERMLLD